MFRSKKPINFFGTCSSEDCWEGPRRKTPGQDVLAGREFMIVPNIVFYSAFPARFGPS
jgi:hypothetical protein